MKVLKTNGEFSGSYISVKIGKKTNTRHWINAPTISEINDLDNYFISTNYPILNTPAKIEVFRRLYELLYIEVSSIQKNMMLHCIGLTKKNKPYINHYYADSKNKDWNDLISKKLADVNLTLNNSNGDVCFYLTKLGVEFILERAITEYYYNTLKS